MTRSTRPPVTTLTAPTAASDDPIQPLALTQLLRAFGLSMLVTLRHLSAGLGDPTPPAQPATRGRRWCEASRRLISRVPERASSTPGVAL
jgi:hypothetical protein